MRGLNDAIVALSLADAAGKDDARGHRSELGYLKNLSLDQMFDGCLDWRRRWVFGSDWLSVRDVLKRFGRRLSLPTAS